MSASITSSSQREPLGEISSNGKKNIVDDDNMTVEEYLERECDKIINKLRDHGNDLASQLRQQFKEESESIFSLVNSSASKIKSIVCTLKCNAGPHMGQKFRLEPKTTNGDDVFKIGRSTGKLFREKGVSMYKDKEISTTHAKIESRNGQLFFTDVRSTNGSSINSQTIKAQCPTRLYDGDIISIGSSELSVKIDDLQSENLDSVDMVSL